MFKFPFPATNLVEGKPNRHPVNLRYPRPRPLCGSSFTCHLGFLSVAFTSHLTYIPVQSVQFQFSNRSAIGLGYLQTLQRSTGDRVAMLGSDDRSRIRSTTPGLAGVQHTIERFCIYLDRWSQSEKVNKHPAIVLMPCNHVSGP